MADALPATLGALLKVARARLAAAGAATPELDARLLLEHFTGATRTDMIARPEQVVEAAELAAVATALERRAGGEPVHRILGFREFHGLRLSLSPDTLEPRPDTETLVEAALPFVRDTAARSGKCRILDLGTGTGAVALALLDAEPAAEAVGVDISGGALETAMRNARELGLADRFSVKESDWFTEISGCYHVIVSNPPYIAASDIDALDTEVRCHDPLRALDGGRDGLDAYRTIAAEAGRYLEMGGIVAVEIGAGQKADVSRIFAENGFALRNLHLDLAGKERVLVLKCAK